jgi:hypothetical protein
MARNGAAKVLTEVEFDVVVGEEALAAEKPPRAKMVRTFDRKRRTPSRVSSASPRSRRLSRWLSSKRRTQFAAPKPTAACQMAPKVCPTWGRRAT